MDLPSTSGEPNASSDSQTTGTAQVMVFYPSWEEFQNFSGYIRKIEEAGAHLSCGIVKVVPPPEFNPRPKLGKDYTDVDGYVIKEPVKESIDGAQGLYVKNNKVFKKQMLVKEFRKLAQSAKYRNPKPELSGLELERFYWRSICNGEPIYGADTEGSIYEPNVKVWNMAQLGTILDETKKSGVDIKGVTSVYLYFGMWKTTFPWHAEDMDLYSINYLHFGEPKYWYAIPPGSSSRFERLMQQQFPDEAQHCRSFLRHKNFIVSPTILRNNNIPFGTMIQRENEFIITFPHGYHMGFNSGYNCAESTNFASDRWIDFGKNAHVCKCRQDSVEIDMRPYMQKYRPEQFEDWFDYWYGEKRTTLKVLSSKRNHHEQEENNEDASVSKRRKGSTPPSMHDAYTVYSSVKGTMKKRTNTSIRKKRLSHKGLVDLWASSPVNLYAERCWNEKRALEASHCAVCQYFQPPQQLILTKTIPISSTRLITNLCFTKDPSRLSTSIIDPCEDILITCDSCAVTVHKHCYPFLNEEDETWLCQRCRNREPTLIRATTCHLCELRGGAYIRCIAGLEKCWVHVICAILSRRTSFDDPLTKQLARIRPPPKHGFYKEDYVCLPYDYLNALGAEHEIAKYECALCGKLQESLIKCVSCEGALEPTYAHATCARLGRMFVEQRDFPLVAVLVCDKHETNTDSDAEMSDVSPGEEVVAWLDDGMRVERGFVMQRFDCEFARIDFLDGSFSRNTPFEDIVSCECLKCDKKYHQPGSRIHVRWSDGLTYGAYYRGHLTSTEYWVRLHSSSKNQPAILPRSAIYSQAERLPEEVKKVLQRSEKN